MTDDPALTRIAQYLGLTYPRDGRPQQQGASRYGRFVSRRVDEDIDALRTEITELRRRLDGG